MFPIKFQMSQNKLELDILSKNELKLDVRPDQL